jgi:hypothetical protein
MNGQVIRIFDRRRLAINLGTEHGVREGTEFSIYTPETVVTDPTTNEDLGQYRRLKATVYAREVFEKFCVAYPPDRREEIDEPEQSIQMGVGVLGLGRRPRTKLVPGQLPVSSGSIEPLPGTTDVEVGDSAEMAPVEAEQEA